MVGHFCGHCIPCRQRDLRTSLMLPHSASHPSQLARCRCCVLCEVAQLEVCHVVFGCLARGQVRQHLPDHRRKLEPYSHITRAYMHASPQPYRVRCTRSTVQCWSGRGGGQEQSSTAYCYQSVMLKSVLQCAGCSTPSQTSLNVLVNAHDSSLAGSVGSTSGKCWRT